MSESESEANGASVERLRPYYKYLVQCVRESCIIFIYVFSALRIHSSDEHARSCASFISRLQAMRTQLTIVIY